MRRKEKDKPGMTVGGELLGRRAGEDREVERERGSHFGRKGLGVKLRRQRDQGLTK